MTIRYWTALVACCSIGSVAFSTSCYAKPQDQEAAAASEKDAAKSGGANRETENSSIPVHPVSPPAGHENRVGLPLLKNIAGDQKAIWTGTKHLHFADADWLLPLGGATAALLATDTEFSKHLAVSPSRLKSSRSFSNYGVGALVGVGGGLYLWGQISHDDHKRETGILAGEAAINSFAAVYALKYAFGRERPLDANFRVQDNYRGRFRVGGDGFPSEHAAAAWSIASVIAHEYPGPLTSLFAYGLAGAVSASRVSAKQHFPSDVLIGSAIGWLEGMYVYRKHHDPTLGGGEWETYAESREEGPEGKTRSHGSPYVELDSWVYPALERLAAIGYVDSEFLGMRPWTRIECAQLAEEAGERIRTEQFASPYISHLYDALAKEFQSDLEELSAGSERSIHLESLYTRTTEITGPPLNDSYHFGQTIINDFGRPYQRGFNTVDGFSGWGTEGRFTIYVRGEYQHAPSAPGFSDSARNLIARLDQIPVPPARQVPAANQFRLLDTYAAANVAGWDLTFGKQSLWWGPGEGSAFLFSNNTEPIYMARASRIAPFTLPWILRYLGPMKWDLFFGKLSGNTYPPRPLIHGEKISFKPTKNLEFGFSRTVELGGVGRPVTFGHLRLSYFSFTTVDNETPNTDPGKRTGGFDFSYRLPFVRNWLSLYSDSLADDDPSPIAAPRRSGVNPGIYLARFPKIQNLDLRVEGVNTNLPTLGITGGRFIYYDTFYRQLYTNKNRIIGSWIGREGTGIQAWSTYSFSPRNTLQFGYRHVKVASDFIPGGETLNDGSVKANLLVRNNLSLSAFVQYEKWTAPVLAPTPQSNWTSSIEISFHPQRWFRRSAGGAADSGSGSGEKP